MSTNKDWCTHTFESVYTGPVIWTIRFSLFLNACYCLAKKNGVQRNEKYVCLLTWNWMFVEVLETANLIHCLLIYSWYLPLAMPFKCHPMWNRLMTDILLRSGVPEWQGQQSLILTNNLQVQITPQLDFSRWPYYTEHVSRRGNSRSDVP